MLDVAEAAQLIRLGGIVGVPTDTVYGLAADPLNAKAVARLFSMKDRDDAKPIAVLVGAASDAVRVTEFTHRARLLAEEHWPGALTIIVPVSESLAEGVGTGGTVGVRMPDHSVALHLLRTVGPLAVTSANRSGRPECLDHECARKVFGGEVDGYLEGSGSRGLSSTVVDVSSGDIRVLREGPVLVT